MASTRGRRKEGSAGAGIWGGRALRASWRTVPLGHRLDVSEVAARRRLRHAERADVLAGHELGEDALLLLLRAVVDQVGGHDLRTRGAAACVRARARPPPPRPAPIGGAERRSNVALHASARRARTSEWRANPGPVQPEYDCSSHTIAGYLQSAPIPPYSSGTIVESSPSSPAAVQSSRGTSPAFSHSSWNGLHSVSKNFRVISRNISGRGGRRRTRRGGRRGGARGRGKFVLFRGGGGAGRVITRHATVFCRAAGTEGAESSDVTLVIRLDPRRRVRRLRAAHAPWSLSKRSRVPIDVKLSAWEGASRAENARAAPRRALRPERSPERIVVRRAADMLLTMRTSGRLSALSLVLVMPGTRFYWHIASCSE